jgi:leader peptidase (prepilin peptidase)/N-methyltransferase
MLTFLFGVSFGSFVNVLIFRLHSGARVSGRSKCLSCSQTLRPRMLIPLFSFCMQRGRCAYCGVRLAIQYPLVELALGILFVVVLSVHCFDPLSTTLGGVLLFIGDLLIWSILLAITVYDLRHKIIPDSFSFALALVAGITLVLKLSLGLVPDYLLPFWDNAIPAWVDFFAGPLLALPFALLWYFSRGRAMGLGDAKLVWGLGWFLGLPFAFSAVVIAFWIAFFPSLLLLLLRAKQFSMKSEIPFAPFLVLGALAVYACHINILGWTF